MIKRILPILVLAVVYFLSIKLLNIPTELPEGTVIPAEVKEILDPEHVDKSIIYSNFRTGWYFFDNALGLIVLGVILMLGFSGKIRDKAKDWAERVTKLNRPLLCGGIAAFFALLVVFLTATAEHPVSGGSVGLALAWGIIGVFVSRSERFALTTFYILIFFLLLEVLNFPFAYYRSFVVEHYFGLSHETFGKWFADLLKGNLVGFIIPILLVPLVYSAVRNNPKSWWAWIAVGSVPVTILMLVIQPVYLDPLFNKYEPLKDEALRDRILSLAEESGISGGRVFQVDKSKETEKINAYVTGVFGTKRIVLWDTTLNKMTDDEVAYVMGHEMGHYVLHHIWKLIIVIAITLFVLLFVISRTIGLLIRKYGDRMGFHELSDIASLPLAMLMLSILMFFVAPVFNGYSRSIEHDADVFGLELTQDGNTAASAFVKLANENLSNPSPHPFVEFWLFNHPTLSDRIAFCKEYGGPEPDAEEEPELEEEVKEETS